MNITNSVYALIGGFLLDLLLGDPHTPWHPACIIGKYICGYEKILRKTLLKGEHNEKKELRAGGYLVILVILTAVMVPWIILMAAYSLHPYLGLAAEIIMCYAVLATRSLKTESMKVYNALKEEGLEEGRKAVSMIVGRDTERLDEKGVVKAAVETIAENFSDGVAAPMFYMMLGGTLAGYFYKAVNTMDSMVGYKNDKYLYFGRAAAKFDDVLNYIPARLSGMLMCGAAAFCGMDSKNAWRIYWRDRYNHSSPNSAHTEATAAGAMHIQLAGNAYYFGKLYEKPTLGDPDRPVEYEDIPRVNRLLYATAILSLVVFGLVKGIVLWLI